MFRSDNISTKNTVNQHASAAGGHGAADVKNDVYDRVEATGGVSHYGDEAAHLLQRNHVAQADLRYHTLFLASAHDMEPGSKCPGGYPRRGILDGHGDESTKGGSLKLFCTSMSW